MSQSSNSTSIPGSNRLGLAAWRQAEWRFAERILVSGIIVLAITLLARYPFVLFPGWSVDSYSNWEGWPRRDFFIAQGRPGQYVVVMLLEAMGFERNASAGVLSGIGLAMFAFASPLLLAAFCRERYPPIFALVLASLVFVLHPFQAEILTFPEASFFPNFATVLGVGAIALVARRPEQWWVGGLVIALALSIYQLVLNYACMMVLIGLVTIVVQRPTGSGRIGTGLRPPIASIGAIAFGVVCYAAVAAGLARIYGVRQDGRGELLAISDVMKRLTEVHSLAADILSKPLLIDLPMMSLVLMIFVALGTTIVIFCSLNKPGYPAMVAALAILAMPVAALGIILVGATWWPMPRVLGGVALLAAMGVYVVLSVPRVRIFHHGAVAAVACILLASTSIGYRVHADQAMVNDHDRFLAQAIYLRLSQLHGYDEDKPLVVVNQHMRWTHPVGVETLRGDMNMSAFFVHGALSGLFSVATGHKLRFEVPDEEESIECNASPGWPSGDAVLLKADRIVLCI